MLSRSNVARAAALACAAVIATAFPAFADKPLPGGPSIAPAAQESFTAKPDISPTPPIIPAMLPFEGCVYVIADPECGMMLEAADGTRYFADGFVTPDHAGQHWYAYGQYAGKFGVLCTGDPVPKPVPYVVSLTLIGCPGDLDVDGHIGGIDLAMLLGDWGHCPICIIAPCGCPSDLNQDGTVNGLDLAQLLATWG